MACSISFASRRERTRTSTSARLSDGAAGGGSDGNWTSLTTPTLDGLGAVGDGAHALHEHVIEDRMPERAALLACLLLGPELKMPRANEVSDGSPP